MKSPACSRFHPIRFPLLFPMIVLFALPARALEQFQRWDKDQNGILSADELPAKLRADFPRFDADKDGALNHKEALAAIKASRNPYARLPDRIEVRRNLAYAETDNPRQTLDLFLPRVHSTNPLPLIVFIHGGGWRKGSKESGSSRLVPFVASGDYIGASINYRLTNEAQWPAQIHDCKAAIRWLRGNAGALGIDADKIAVWGSSAGGHLVSMMGTSGDVKLLEGTLGRHLDQSSRVSAVVNFFGPENFITMVQQESSIDRTSRDYPEALLLGGRVQDQPEVAKYASPVTWITDDDPPFLTAHGTRDPLVPYAQATELDRGLEAAGVFSILITMKDAGHGFKSVELDRIIRAFLDQTLRGKVAELKDHEIAP